MKHQLAFDRVLELEDAKLAKQLVRYLFAEYPSKHQPLTQSEIAELGAKGIALNSSARFSHAEAVKAACEAAANAELPRVCAAFLHGLDGEAMSFRAPLRALAICRNLPAHRYVAWRNRDDSPCSVCGVHRTHDSDPVEGAHFVYQDGTCGEDLIVSAWTLNWFAKTEFPPPDQERIRGMHELLDFIAQAPGNCTATKLAAQSGHILGGNKYSREFAFETLGLAGALRCPRLPGLLQTWTDHDKRPQSGEMIAPASLWRREDGFDPAVFSELFPQCQLPKTLIATHNKA